MKIFTGILSAFRNGFGQLSENTDASFKKAYGFKTHADNQDALMEQYERYHKIAEEICEMAKLHVQMKDPYVLAAQAAYSASKTSLNVERIKNDSVIYDNALETAKLTFMSEALSGIIGGLSTSDINAQQVLRIKAYVKNMNDIQRNNRYSAGFSSISQITPANISDSTNGLLYMAETIMTQLIILKTSRIYHQAHHARDDASERQKK